MLKFPCLVLDHDDTVVQSEATLNYPFFVSILDQFRPGTTITLKEYVNGCCQYGFADMCRKWYGFTEKELVDEYKGWQEYIKVHTPDPFPGIASIIHRHKNAGGILCVVSHSSDTNILRDYRTHFGLIPDAIYSWDLPEHLRKPSTFPLEDIMKKYGFSPSQMLVIDDMMPACKMAHNANVPIAFAAWGRTDYPDLSAQMRKLCNFSFETPEALEHFLFDEV